MKRPLVLDQLLEATEARIGLGRAGSGVPTSAMLDFQLAHARARDAVHAQLDTGLLTQQLGLNPLEVHSAAADRQTYLQRPDLGRRLDQASATSLHPGDYDAAFVIADGLSAKAVHDHAVAVFSRAVGMLDGWHIAPPVLARQARVALGDEVGAALGARLVIVLIGERPGLSAADSLGAYLTWAPAPGRRDSERNCISNIRPPRGLSYDAAADLLVWLMREARKRQASGVTLKDERGLTDRIAAGRPITEG